MPGTICDFSLSGKVDVSCQKAGLSDLNQSKHTSQYNILNIFGSQKDNTKSSNTKLKSCLVMLCCLTDVDSSSIINFYMIEPGGPWGIEMLK